MKGITTGFRRNFGFLAVIGLFSLALGISLFSLNKANAQVVEPAVEMGVTPGTIDKGESAILDWSSIDATTVTISPGIGEVEYKGETTVSPDRTTTYTIVGTNATGGRATGSVTLIVRENGGSNPTVDISASPNTVCPGGVSTLSWSSTNADTVSINQGIGSVPANGSGDVEVDVTTTFTITATNDSGSDTDSVTVNVSNSGNCGGGNPPTVTLRADDNSIDEGDETELTWSSTNADYCSRSGGRNGWSDDRVGTSGDFDTGSLHSDTTYTIRCYNEFGSDSDSETVRVNEDDDNNNDRVCRDRSATNYNRSWPCRYPSGNNLPTVVIYADQTNLAYNGATFVRWSSLNATSCTASGGSVGWPGPKSIGPGSFYTGSLTSSRTYTLTCYNNVGSDTDSVTVSVRPRTVSRPPTPRPVGSSLVIVNSSIDRNQPIVPTLDNTRPRPGDEITYTVNYQNIGTAAITNLVLRLDLPYEVQYLYSTPPNPTISGNTLIFNLGTLRANGSGTVTVRVRVRDDAPAGALLNFPAVLSYIDPAGFPQTVTANVSAQVWTNPVNEVEERVSLVASVFGSGGDFFPDTLFGWLLLFILILLLIALVRYLLAGGSQGFARKTTTTTVQH